MQRLHEIAESQGISLDNYAKLAEVLDENDELSRFRDKFILPEMSPSSTIGMTGSVVYLSGNSLGLQPKSLRSYLHAQLDKWGSQGVDGHFVQPTPWLTIDETVEESMAALVGCKKNEVLVMNSLTVNLHLMMCSFYKPTKDRYKIIIEKKAFPSGQSTHSSNDIAPTKPTRMLPLLYVISYVNNIKMI